MNLSSVLRDDGHNGFPELNLYQTFILAISEAYSGISSGLGGGKFWKYFLFLDNFHKCLKSRGGGGPMPPPPEYDHAPYRYAHAVL